MKLTKDTLIEGKIYEKGTEYSIKERKQDYVSFRKFTDFAKEETLKSIKLGPYDIGVEEVIMNPKYTATGDILAINLGTIKLTIEPKQVSEVAVTLDDDYNILSAEIILNTGNRIFTYFK